MTIKILFRVHKSLDKESKQRIVGDKVFETFYAIELVQRTFLKDVGNPQHCVIDVDAVQQEMVKDSDVQFWWALVCVGLDNDLAEILLKKFVKLWVTLRGFSYASDSIRNVLRLH